MKTKILTTAQILGLRNKLLGRKVVVCFGGGVDSTAMLVALQAAGIRPDVITMADTKGEKPATYQHVEKMQLVLEGWGFPKVNMVTYKTKPHFGDTWENLVRNAESFPSSNTSVGLGRKFAWNQWALVNGVVDENFKVRRDRLETFAAKAAALRGDDNALDRRSCAA